ncbi:zf-HC2 domain-containing protein [Streptomyces sp. B1866]|uniref:zf-HC2 domain-containing protein n=1 Tax=Streptomyces sp. B1866 TaxID=3075431 RepID=UPI00289046F2|nr:zf-HC2 domain-containing protein [Streptomyces sp. B1866]MDT3399307.1 zf-HC2 domain-containing protein [Streptomyces sp. B1866]
MTSAADHERHIAVGAYALGLLDEAAAARFEDHLAGCERCAAELAVLVGLEPLLADLAAPGSAPGPTPGPTPGTGAPGTGAPVPAPSPALLDRLLGDVAAARRARRARLLALAAAAAVLVVGGPFAGAALTSDGGSRPPADPVRALYEEGRRATATDRATGVAATVSLVDRPWGTDVALRLENVGGPRRCALVAVGRDGHEETVTTWSVPAWGYGVRRDADGGAPAWSERPLYTHGAAAMPRDGIERFEVRTLDGRRLVTVRP